MEAAGLQALCAALADLGEVIVVAPHRQRSAVSHAITLHKPLRLEEVAAGRFACTGTPADCVYIGLHHVLDRAPDLVISGINEGPNLGDDVIYSGTAAGAREASLVGLPSIAASLGWGDAFVPAASIIRDLTEDLLGGWLPDGVYLNVNLPEKVDVDTPLRLTTLGERHYGREVRAERDPRGRGYYWIGGADLGTGDVAGSDGNALRDGFVSVTPVRARNTTHDSLAAFRRRPWAQDGEK
jgi:5'-nucleotidase